MAIKTIFFIHPKPEIYIIKLHTNNTHTDVEAISLFLAVHGKKANVIMSIVETQCLAILIVVREHE